jgi:Holliday junction resolvase RusA-like endonuclease
MKFNIEGSIPSKKNCKIMICRGSRPLIISSQKYRDWHTEQAYKIARYRPNKPYNECKIEIRYWLPNKRKSDMDNKSSSILDLLKDMEFIEDDCCTCVQILNQSYKGIDKENPRAEVEISLVGHYST